MMHRLFVSLIIAVSSAGAINCSSAPSAPGGPSVGRAMSFTEMVGGPNGKEVSPRYCKSGIVTEVYGTVGKQKLYHLEYEVITSLGMRCSDGTDLGAMGTVKGKPFSIKNDRGTEDGRDKGFSFMATKSGAFLDSITLMIDEKSRERIRYVGTAGGSGGDYENTLGCGNEKIIGYTGRSDGAVDAIQVICGSEESEEKETAEKATF